MHKKRFEKILITAAIGILVLGHSAEGFGQPRRYARPRAVIKQPFPRYGRGVGHLPPRHRSVVVGKSRYYSYGGWFYKRRPHGYVVVKAPLGAIVATIPIGHVTFAIAGTTYYYYGGVYYRKVPSGYVVIEAPPESVIVEETPANAEDAYSPGEKVSVTAQLLNVRSGPGNNHPVIVQIQWGTTVVVRGHAPGWLYVKLPGGKFGWIMSKFTASITPPASG